MTREERFTPLDIASLAVHDRQSDIDRILPALATGWSVLGNAPRPWVENTAVHVFLVPLALDSPGDDLGDLPLDGRDRPLRWASGHRPGYTRTLVALRRLLRLVAPATRPVPLYPDRLGRPVPAAGPLWVALSRQDDTMMVAVSLDCRVEVSLQGIPRAVDDSMKLVLTSTEQRWVAGLPAPRRPEAVARLWTRKDATLRLVGYGVWGTGPERTSFAGIASLNSVPDDDTSPHDVDVYDLPRCGEFVAAVASRDTPARIGLWLLDEKVSLG